MISNRRSTAKRQIAGFTLLELMISIAMFALMSVAAYRLFDSVLHAQRATESVWEKISSVQRALLVFDRDFAQAVSRPVKNEYGQTEQAFIAGKSDYLVEFTRGGWRNPLGLRRSELQRVAYWLDDEGRLMRRYWLDLDRHADSEPVDQLLLENVSQFDLQVQDAEQGWHRSWPKAGAQVTADVQGSEQQKGKKPLPVPLAIALSFEHEYYGALEYVVPMVNLKDYAEVKDDKKKDQESGSEEDDEEYYDDEEYDEEDEE
ncbi:type II secretion system minor pseudopilin GspJ [Endozoicomonadaceae bacterium StTr2]